MALPGHNLPESLGRPHHLVLVHIVLKGHLLNTTSGAAHFSPTPSTVFPPTMKRLRAVTHLLIEQHSTCYSLFASLLNKLQHALARRSWKSSWDKLFLCRCQCLHLWFAQDKPQLCTYPKAQLDKHLNQKHIAHTCQHNTRIRLKGQGMAYLPAFPFDFALPFGLGFELEDFSTLAFLDRVLDSFSAGSFFSSVFLLGGCVRFPAAGFVGGFKALPKIWQHIVHIHKQVTRRS